MPEFEMCNKIHLKGWSTNKSTFLKNSHSGNGPMSFAAKKKKEKKKDAIKSRQEPPLTHEKNYLQKFDTIPLKSKT